MFNFTNLTYRGAAALALTLILHTTQASAAETCVAAPTCAELGYTLTSAAHCAGTALKCPFDASKYYCTTKTDVAYAASPDYTDITTRNANTTYTAFINGVIYGGENQRADPGKNRDAYVALWIDGKNVREGAEAQVSWSSNSWAYPIRKGSTYRLEINSNGAETWHSFKFSPTN